MEKDGMEKQRDMINGAVTKYLKLIICKEKNGMVK